MENEIPRTVVSKSDYARLHSRTPAAVSQWLKDGKISKEALIGEGRNAKIWVERADLDLQETLDTVQQSFRPAAANAGATDAEIARRHRLALAKRAEHEAAMARRREMAEAGKWVRADEAQAEWMRQLSKTFGQVEHWARNVLPKELAGLYRLKWQALAVDVRKSFHALRTEMANAAHDERVQLEAAERAQQDEIKDGQEDIDRGIRKADVGASPAHDCGDRAVHDSGAAARST